MSTNRVAAVNWAMLLIVSAVVISILQAGQLPAAFLIGPMLSAMLLSVLRRPARTQPGLVAVSQAFIGLLMANAIPFSVLADIARDWPLFIGGILSVVAVSVFFGWLLAYYQILPGTTTIWGSMPGAASAMTILSESYGADMRLVAIMQYSRVICVALAASIVSRLFLNGPAAAPRSPDWFPHLEVTDFSTTILLALSCFFLARYLRFQAGIMLFPLVAGAVLQDAGLIHIVLPPWLMAIAYALVGWSIGQRYTAELLVYAAKAMPRILLAIASLIVICGGFAFLLMHLTGLDGLTAYLATSPGGADTVAIISASTPVDVSFVMAMQVARFLLVLLTGPMIARTVAKHARLDG